MDSKNQVQQKVENPLYLEHMRRNQIFNTGVLKIQKEYEKVSSKKSCCAPGGKKEKVLKTFEKLPNFLPIQLDETENPKDKLETNNFEVEILTEQEKLDSSRVIKDYNDEQELKKVIKKTKPIQIGQVVYSKPIAIIINPNSGKKKDLKGQIEKALNERKDISYEFIYSQRVFHTYELANTIDLDKYCMVVAVGGDGTYHEILNGMLQREDKKRLPIAIVPNGSGDDNAFAVGIDNVDEALKYILKGQTMKIDVNETLLDHENKEEITKDIHKYQRYSTLLVSFGLIAKIAEEAVPLKTMFGKAAYQIIAIKHFIKKQKEIWDVYFDNKLVYDNLSTMCLLILNSKRIAQMFNSPVAVTNDGLMDTTLQVKDQTRIEMINDSKESKDGKGVQLYKEGGMEYRRSKTMRVVNKNGQEMGCNIDGEVVKFTNFAKINNIKQDLEVVVDYDYLMKKSGYN